jgi:mannitol/fructose-specific phosphotransferase system IIA component (Ntr-type)
VDLPNVHLQLLAAIARLAREGKKRLIEKLIEARNEKEVLQIIEEEENKYEV